MSDDEHPRNGGSSTESPPTAVEEKRAKARAMGWLKGFVRGKASNTNHLQEAIDDYIEELKEVDHDDVSADSQKELIANVLKTRDLKVYDVMIPRADIVALEQDSTVEDLREIMREKQFSRLPVYEHDLDKVVGMLHIKDVLGALLDGKPVNFREMSREALIVSPSIPLMELFLTMREDKKHMAMVVDEHGGIDGLVTLNDVIEAIVGDIEDEFDNEDQPQVIEKSDGSVIADARIDIEDFEDRYGRFLDADEREDIDTLGGLTFHMAGHIPKRGEIFKHSSGMVIEVLDADARRINRLRLRNLPVLSHSDEV